jgi:glutamate--cysteine ligase
MTDAPPLTERAAEDWLARHCFDTGPAGFVGATVELLPVPLLPVDGPPGPVIRRLRHGHLSGDYAGVVAVSSPPSPGLDVCVRRTEEDVALARDVLARHGFGVGERALDPYTAGVPAAAAVRVCLDAGDEESLARRWAAAHAVGPVLAGAFANSPLLAGRPTGWRSTRQARRLAMDSPMPSGDPRRAWAAYVLDGAFGGPSLRRRLRGPGADLADLLRHLDALPAPVRARGHLELTMVDAQPGDGWRVALAVTAALVDDVRAAEAARAATRSLPADAWLRAARHGLADPVLADAARQCFVAAYAALARQGVARELRDEVATFVERYVHRSRCPADDVLDAARV